MKYSILRVLLLVIVLFISLFALAHDIQVDGIYYNVNASNLTCEVTNNGDNSYNGDIIIPETVKYKNKTLKVTSIGNRAFYNCADLTSIAISKAITNIGESAFYGCKKITSIIIPNSVTRINNYAFSGCNSLKELIIEDGDKTLELGNCNFSYTNDGWTANYYCGLFYSNPIETIYLGRDISSSAFYNNLYREGNRHIREVVIGNSVTTIGNSAFYGCRGLVSVIIGNSVNYIGDGAFSNCDNLIYIYYTSTTPPTSLWTVTNTYVPNISSYSKSSIINGNAIYIEEYVTFETDSATYGTHFDFIWSSNIDTTEYETSAPDVELLQNAGMHTIEIPFTFSRSNRTFNVIIPYTYTINKAPITVKTDSLSRLYGEENPDFTLSYSGFVNGEDESVLINKGIATTSASFKSNVGEYPITISGVTADNYEAQYETGVLHIKKAPISVAVNNASKIYGDNNPQFTLSYSGLKNGETSPEMISAFNTSTDATQSSNVGEYDIVLSGGEAKNYEITNYVNGLLTVKKAPLTITANNATKIYGEEKPSFDFLCTGLKNNDTSNTIFSQSPILTCSATNYSDVGNYDIIVNGGETYNYEIKNYVNGTLNITKAPLTISANDYTRSYGDENPVFEYTCTGLKNNDNPNEIFKTKPQTICSATETNSVGKYDINIIGGEAKNYEITNCEKGVLTIEKAQLTAILNNVTKVYGDENPEYTLSYNGLKNGETSPEMISAFNTSTDATQSSNVGEYDIVLSGGEAKNYEIVNYVNGKLTVIKAPLTVIANNSAKLYGDANPEFKYSVNGAKNNDDESSIFITNPTVSCIADEKSDVGEYNIDIEGASSENYEISYRKGLLTVNKRELLVSTKNYTRIYGEENPDFEISYNGFVNNDDESVLLIKPKVNIIADKDSNVGNYDITIEGGDDDNYSFAYNNGTLTIEKANQTITWEQELNDLVVGSQIELTAKSSSGLDIEYIIPDNTFLSVYTIGSSKYLDCYDAGEIVIRATQNGNKNYNAAVRVSKTIKVVPTSISGVSADATVKVNGNSITLSGANNNSITIYSTNGTLIEKIDRYAGEEIVLDKGVYIIRVGNKTMKVKL